MSISSLAAAQAVKFKRTAAIAGCGGGCGGGPGGGCVCTPPSFPPGAAPGGGYTTPRPPGGSAVPMVGENGSGAYGLKTVPMHSGDNYRMPCAPYEDEKADSRNMTLVVGEATIAGGATTLVQVQPTMGNFSMFYFFLLAVDAANPQSQQRVGVGQFSVGDCPGDCRTIDVFSDVFEPSETCCNGRPLRAQFGRILDGTALGVNVTNLNVAGSVIVQAIARGYCHRGSCAC